MLSLENLGEYCRTCLHKLDKNCEDDTSEPVPIHKFPDLEHLMHLCLAKSIVGCDKLCSYAPFLCPNCFHKWFDFSNLYQEAVKTDEKIRAVLEREILKTGNKSEESITDEQKDDITQYFINTEELGDVDQVEKYETSSPFFSNFKNSINNKNKVISIDDPTKPNGPYEHITINSTTSVCERDDGISSSFSDNLDDTLFISNPKKKNNKKIKKPHQNKGTRKSLCRYKSKNNLNKILANNANETITELDDNDAKKVRYECEKCKKYFWKKNKYDGHMKQVHEGIMRPYKCQQCGKAYNLYKTLLQHKRECHSEKCQDVFKCDKCDKIFKTGVILKQHLTNKHSEHKEAMRSICDQCGFIAAHQYSLSRHIINKHTETDQIKCDQCPKVFKTQYSLKYHVIGNHNPSNIKPFKCPECQMAFTRKTLLNQHKRTHLQYNERIKCDFEGCEVRFVKHGDKTHHMRLVHLKVKQHICDFCGEAFGAMQTLRHHRFIHTGEKPYNCNICGQGFRQRTAMKTHRKTHIGKEIEKQNFIKN